MVASRCMQALVMRVHASVAVTLRGSTNALGSLVLSMIHKIRLAIPYLG